MKKEYWLRNTYKLLEVLNRRMDNHEDDFDTISGNRPGSFQHGFYAGLIQSNHSLIRCIDTIRQKTFHDKPLNKSDLEDILDELVITKKDGVKEENRDKLKKDIINMLEDHQGLHGEDMAIGASMYGVLAERLIGLFNHE